MGSGLGRLWKGATQMTLLLQALMTGRVLVMQCLGGMTEVNFGCVKPLACPLGGMSVRQLREEIR